MQLLVCQHHAVTEIPAKNVCVCVCACGPVIMYVHVCMNSVITYVRMFVNSVTTYVRELSDYVCACVCVCDKCARV